MAKQNQMTHRGIADAALYLAGLALHGVNVRQALAPLYRCERALTKGERAEARRWWDAFVCVSPALNPRTRRLLDTELAALCSDAYRPPSRSLNATAPSGRGRLQPKRRARPTSSASITLRTSATSSGAMPGGSQSRPSGHPQSPSTRTR